MTPDMTPDATRIRAAWEGRISGCLLGKPLEVLSYREGRAGLRRYLAAAGALPLSGYVPALPGSLPAALATDCCAGHIERAAADDDTNYSVLALELLEAHGAALCTEDVARQWLLRLPAGATWTAERLAYLCLLGHADSEFVNGAPPGFDLADCADNSCNEWIGAQIRADVYGWVCPGQPALAAELAGRDAALSHRREGIQGARFIAALGAAIPVAATLGQAFRTALREIPPTSACADAVCTGVELAGRPDAIDRLHEKYAGMSPVHTVNNLAVVAWALCSAADDFTAAITNAVWAGWDTDSNAATVGGLAGLWLGAIPDGWTAPWNGRLATDLAGCSEITVDALCARTVAVAMDLEPARAA